MPPSFFRHTASDHLVYSRTLDGPTFQLQPRRLMIAAGAVGCKLRLDRLAFKALVLLKLRHVAV